jgi:hypothetical protein
MGTQTDPEAVERLPMERDNGPWVEQFAPVSGATTPTAPVEVVESAANSSPHTELGEAFMKQANDAFATPPQPRRGADDNTH